VFHGPKGALSCSFRTQGPRISAAGGGSPNALTRGCQMVYFHTKKSQFGYILEGHGMENFGLFYDNLICILWKFDTSFGHLVYFIAIWNIWWSFGIYFHRFWFVLRRIIWQPCVDIRGSLCDTAERFSLVKIGVIL
jgi:hypothetical protein